MSIDAFNTVRRRAGMSVAEFVVAMGISVIVLAALSSFALFHSRGFAATMHYVELDQASQNAINAMCRELRGMDRITNSSAIGITAVARDGTEIRYRYENRTRTLIRVAGGRTNTLLTGCEIARFTVEQNSTNPRTLDCLVATNDMDVKAVTINFVCSRAILGQSARMQTPHTARVVLRN